jgi:hypothetical protein
MGLDTKTHWLADSQSQCDFDLTGSVTEVVEGSYESVINWRSEARRIFSSEVPEFETPCQETTSADGQS